jgi:DnaK suppressor protein
MNNSEHQTLIAIIEKRIKRLDIILETGNAIEKQAKEELKYDESARLDSLNHKTVDDKLYLAAKQELAQLKSNLDWLNSSVAGECEECSSDIPMKRLIVVPTTRECVNCSAKIKRSIN